MARIEALCAAALVAACAGPGAESVDITKPIVGEAATNAEKAFKRAEGERKSSNYLEATRYYEWVKNNFPYSQYASLSELALADMAFDRDDHESAAKAYEEFVKRHPSHPSSDYAAFRIGLARYLDRASDTFILPPSYEREQTPIKNALDAFNRFISGYPTSTHLADARKHAADCRRRLANHERYVAEFYARRQAWKGSAGRWLLLANSYGDLQGGKMRGEALWKAGEALRQAGDLIGERAALQRLVKEAPDDARRADAERRLQQIPSVPPAALQPPPPK